MSRAQPTDRWTELVNAGVLGTERLGKAVDHSGEPWSLGGEGVQSDDYLSNVATLGIYELAGRFLPSAPTSVTESFAIDEPVCSAPAGRHLETILFGNRGDVLAEWCAAASDAGCVAPPEFIPTLLTRAAATRDATLRQVLHAAAGKRGEWLSTFNEEWRVLCSESASPDELVELWESGETSQRIAALKQLRRTCPGKVIEILSGSWNSEPAAERVRFLQVLKEETSNSDERFLESCLDDRSKLVRAAAAELLSGIPESALSERMARRVAQFVAFTPGTGKLLKKKPKLDISAPAELDEAATRDSLEMKAGGGLGGKAVLLLRLVTLAPLTAWERDSATPADWIEAALVSDWTDVLLQGWTNAAVRQQDAAWAEALLTAVFFEKIGAKLTSQNAGIMKLFAPLLSILSPETADRWLTKAVEDGGRHMSTEYTDAALIACDFRWGEGLSNAVVGAMKKRLESNDAVYAPLLRQLLGVAATNISPQVADRISQQWTTRQEHWSANFSQLVHDAIDTIRFRREMLAELRKPK